MVPIEVVHDAAARALGMAVLPQPFVDAAPVRLPAARDGGSDRRLYLGEHVGFKGVAAPGR